MAPALNRQLLLQCQLVLASYQYWRKKQRDQRSKKRKHRFWVRKIFQQRQEYGQYHTLFQEVRLQDREYFFRYLRMSAERLEHLLSLVGPHIATKKCWSRLSISPQERLVITLRYLATGDSQQSQSFNFRIGRATACKIIKETCRAIWNALRHIYLKPPTLEKEWKAIADGYNKEWNFPTCIGSLDGKHIAMDCPKNGGSNFYNYKGFHIIVLMAVCDSAYCFSLVDIGGYGKDNVAAIFNQSEINLAFENNTINLPNETNVDGDILPYVLVSYEIFQLKPWLMKPYPGRNLDENKQIYNYRLLRARRTIENSFGILSAKWRIFRRPIRASVKTTELIVQACICLHNYLKQTDNAMYIPTGFVDSEDSTGKIIAGSWREIIATEGSAWQPVKRLGSNNSTAEAKDLRQKFVDYFISKQGSVSWQVKHIRSTGEKLV